MLTRVTPWLRSTASRSASAVRGEVSTEHGTTPTSNVARVADRSRSNCPADRYVGVPPPTAMRATVNGRPIAFRTARICRTATSTYAAATSSAGLAVVNRLQNPHRISQNGTCR